MDVPQLQSAVESWARERLTASAIPQAKRADAIWLVEPGAICFTCLWASAETAWTALLKDGTSGPCVYKIVRGWPLTDLPVPEPTP